MTVTVHVTGDDDAQRKIRAFAVVLGDLRPFWPVVTRLFIGWERLQFESEGGFWNPGARWAPLSSRYRERKRLLWGERPILQAGGQVRRAASQPTRHATPTTLTLTIDDEKAAPARQPSRPLKGHPHGPVAQYHDEGEGVPRRPIVGDTFPPLALYELERAGDAHVSEMLRRLAL